MDLAVAATVFALVIPAELPDKTFISCLVLASRHRPLAVWTGAAAALILQAAVAVVAGGLIDLLPKLVVGSVVAALFLGGALYLLFTTAQGATERGERLAAGEERTLAAGRPEFWRVAVITFGVIAVAELGDITQVLIANLAAHDHDKWAVFLGAAVGLSLVSVCGVVAGRTITRRVPLAVVRRLSGACLLGLGVYSIVSLATS